MKTLALFFLIGTTTFANTSITAIIKNPIHEGTKLSISNKSNPDGVCKYLGYDSAIHGSVRLAQYTTEEIRRYRWKSFVANVPNDDDRYTYILIDSKPETAEAAVLDDEGVIRKQKISKIISQITCLSEK